MTIYNHPRGGGLTTLARAAIEEKAEDSILICPHCLGAGRERSNFQTLKKLGFKHVTCDLCGRAVSISAWEDKNKIGEEPPDKMRRLTSPV